MIQSMTAFARTVGEGDWGNAVIELRSVNHRYLDISIRFPEMLTSIEGPIREKVRKMLNRGKLEVNLRFKPGPAVTANLKINETNEIKRN